MDVQTWRFCFCSSSDSVDSPSTDSDLSDEEEVLLYVCWSYMCKKDVFQHVHVLSTWSIRDALGAVTHTLVNGLVNPWLIFP